MPDNLLSLVPLVACLVLIARQYRKAEWRSEDTAAAAVAQTALVAATAYYGQYLLALITALPALVFLRGHLPRWAHLPRLRLHHH